MHTLKDVWQRLKALLDAVSKSKDPKADLKTAAGAISLFTPGFLKSLAQIEKLYQERAKLEAQLKISTDAVMKSVVALEKKLTAAHASNDNLDGRLDELNSRMKELNQYGFQVQWD